MSVETIQTVGYEWRKAASVHDAERGVAVQTLGGDILLLYRVEAYQAEGAGGIRLALVLPWELKTGDEY